MKCGTKAALAIGVGYVLGRKHKMRLAGIMAATAATGGLAGRGGAILLRGMKALGGTDLADKLSPQMRELTETIREDLVTVGKAAATAAVSSRVESLTNSMHDRAEALRNPAETGTEAGRAAAGGARRTGERAAGGRRGGRDTGDHVEDLEDDERYDEEPDVDDSEDIDDEAGTDEPAEDETDEPPVPARPRPTARRRSPVARAER
jgi:hypothetical protein